MKDTNNKIIVGLLAVIAVCMITIVAILLMNRSNGANNTQVVNEAVNEEYSAEENTQQGNTESQSNVSVSATESPYYQYEGELSDTPITPTEVENIEKLDYSDYKCKGNEYDLRVLYAEEILRIASEYEVYANPTILDEYMPPANPHGVVVDLHTKDNKILTIQTGLLDEQKRPTFLHNVSSIDYNNIYSNNGVYILNACCLKADYMNKVGMTEDEANAVEKKIVDTIVKKLKEEGTTNCCGSYMYITSYNINPNDKTYIDVSVHSYSKKDDVVQRFTCIRDRKDLSLDELDCIYNYTEERSTMNYRERYGE